MILHWTMFALGCLGLLYAGFLAGRWWGRQDERLEEFFAELDEARR